jgi:hypothetical protein
MTLFLTILSIPALLPTSSAQIFCKLAILERLQSMFFPYSNTPPEKSSNKLVNIYPTIHNLPLILERSIVV